MIQLLKNLKKGFRGEPDFSMLVDHSFTLEDTLLTYKTPANYMTDPTCIRRLIPKLDAEWFSSNCKEHYHQTYVRLDYQQFGFLNPIINPLIPYNSPGSLFLRLSIKIVPEDVNALDLDVLSQFLYQDYYDFYNDPIEPKECSARGIHRIAMEEAEEFANKLWPLDNEDGLSNEELKEREEFLLSRFYNSYPPIKPQVIQIGENRFVHYLEGNIDRKEKLARFYCLPINKRFYIDFQFYYWIHRSVATTKFMKWVNNTEWLDRKILETVQLSKVVDAKAQEIAGKLAQQ